LAAFVVAASMDEQQILDALRDKLDPAFLPRPLFKVDKLPRNGAGKLSRQSLLELFQRSERPRQERQACE
jgi:acyl-coenzyme A synthetase/AMP-(fatty) acid ligase